MITQPTSDQAHYHRESINETVDCVHFEVVPRQKGMDGYIPYGVPPQHARPAERVVGHNEYPPLLFGEQSNHPNMLFTHELPRFLSRWESAQVHPSGHFPHQALSPMITAADLHQANHANMGRGNEYWNYFHQNLMLNQNYGFLRAHSQPQSNAGHPYAPRELEHRAGASFPQAYERSPQSAVSTFVSAAARHIPVTPNHRNTRYVKIEPYHAQAKSPFRSNPPHIVQAATRASVNAIPEHGNLSNVSAVHSTTSKIGTRLYRRSKRMSDQEYSNYMKEKRIKNRESIQLCRKKKIERNIALETERKLLTSETHLLQSVKEFVEECGALALIPKNQLKKDKKSENGNNVGQEECQNSSLVSENGNTEPLEFNVDDLFANIDDE